MTSTSLNPELEHGRKPRVVLACSDFSFVSQEVLVSLLREKGLEPVVSSSLEDTKFLLRQEETALAICHASAGDGAFRDLLRAADRKGSKVPVIVCTDCYDPHLYLEAMDLGAFDYFAYPYYRDGVEWVVTNALREAQSNERNSCETERALESVPC